MNDRALAAVFVLFTWWLSTGVVLWTVWLRRSTFGRSSAVAGVLALVGTAGLMWSAHAETRLGAYVAFCGALAVWAWHELSFLLGLVTGPRRSPCPPEARGWHRFALATSAVIHHEIALAATVVAVVALTWGAPNQVGAGTFLVLWVMRLSAKLNVFLGVRNLTEQFVPEHLRYLRSYFRKARLNPLMPLSVLGGSVVAFRLARRALSTEANTFTAIGATLLATILGLAVLEHVFLVVPVRDAVLWRWAAQRARPGRAAQASAET